MTVILCSDGYEKIDARIQAIENLANDGVFSLNDAPKFCQQILLETKKFRQILRKVLIFAPDKPVVSNGEGSAA
jgi:hypothetical protein